MKVSFNPVSFRANDNYQNKTNNKEPIGDSTVVALNKDLENAKTAKSDVELFNTRLHDKNWEKTYNYGGVHVKFPNSYDGTEYQITSTGKVIQMDGWSSPKVILEKHDELGKYVQAMKDYNDKVLQDGISLQIGSSIRFCLFIGYC